MSFHIVLWVITVTKSNVSIKVGSVMTNPEADHELFVRYQTRHQRRLLSYILTLVPNWNDAEEILQETSLVLWRKFTEFQPGTSYNCWATRVAYFEVKKFRDRRKRSDILFSNELVDLLASEADEARDLLADQHEALQFCLEKLKRDDHRLITSRYLRGASSASLANELGRTLESVCNSLKRIRIALLRCVQRQEVEAVV